MTTRRSVVIVRYGEIGLKGGNRSRFERLLKRRVGDALRGLEHGELARPHGRILIRDPGDTRACAERAARVFGVKSASPAESVEPVFDAIVPATERVLHEALSRRGRSQGAGLTMRVDSRRVDKSFPLRSVDLNADVGGRLLAAHPGLSVNLRRPDVTVGIEVRRDEALVYADNFAGPGGLPIGSLGSAVALFSGGIDSPVAAWLAMKRGIRVTLLHFHAPPFVGEASREKAVDLSRALSRYSADMHLHVAPFGDIQVEIKKNSPERYRTILYRRSMNRVAARLADAVDAGAFVTGESLGQVASQTLENLACIEDSADRLVLRPLATFDKEETILLARRIGTYDTSLRRHPDCCTLFQPQRPKIRGSIEECRALERELDLPALEQASFDALDHVVARNGELA